MSRDDQFRGFAKALISELFDNHVYRSAEDTQLIIARRAYDLAIHTASFMMEPEARRMWAGMLSPRQVVEMIPVPDMTAFPKD